MLRQEDSSFWKSSACMMALTWALIVLSISARVMFPLSLYLITPMDSHTIAASMIPIEGMFKIDAFPLNAGSIRSFQFVIGRPTRSGRIPSVSAL